MSDTPIPLRNLTVEQIEAELRAMVEQRRKAEAERKAAPAGPDILNYRITI